MIQDIDVVMHEQNNKTIYKEKYKKMKQNYEELKREHDKLLKQVKEKQNENR